MKIPLIQPNPPRFSELKDALVDLEDSGIFSNYGPINARFETRLIAGMFSGEGACVTVANATLGLMLAVRQQIGWRPRGRYALMPSFTFAATAHAALWCGLTPLLCDIDPGTWLPDANAEVAMLERHGDDIAVILPNATFGACLDLARYRRISSRYGVPVVIDAAASLGSLDVDGQGFGAGSAHPVVFSMHVTKAFATAEGGVVYSANPSIIADVRAMGNFGFGEARSATLPGLNAKLSETAALLGLAKLGEIEAISEHRRRMFEHYQSRLPDFTFQRMTGIRSAHQFVPVLVPETHAGAAETVIQALAARGIGAARYFAPHLFEQPFFRGVCVSGDLAVTDWLSRRVIALPMSDFITPAMIDRVCEAFREALHAHSNLDRVPRRRRTPAYATRAQA
jgi:dTDP-4-amino-4,6-dideoxygalactose transaminase